MAKEHFKITPITDTASKEVMDRFVLELNTTLESVSERLPNLTPSSLTQLKSSEQTLTTITSRRPTVIPQLNANPVDVDALKNDLEQKVMAANRTELAAMKQSIDDLANVVSKLYAAVLG